MDKRTMIKLQEKLSSAIEAAKVLRKVGTVGLKVEDMSTTNFMKSKMVTPLGEFEILTDTLPKLQTNKQIITEHCLRIGYKVGIEIIQEIEEIFDGIPKESGVTLQTFLISLTPLMGKRNLLPKVTVHKSGAVGITYLK